MNNAIGNNTDILNSTIDINASISLKDKTNIKDNSNESVNEQLKLSRISVLTENPSNFKTNNELDNPNKNIIKSKQILSSEGPSRPYSQKDDSLKRTPAFPGPPEQNGAPGEAKSRSGDALNKQQTNKESEITPSMKDKSVLTKPEVSHLKSVSGSEPFTEKGLNDVEIKKLPEKKTSGKNFTLPENDSVENNDKKFKIPEVVQNNPENENKITELNLTTPQVPLKNVNSPVPVKEKSENDDEIKKPSELEFKFTTEIPNTQETAFQGNKSVENNVKNLVTEIETTNHEIDNKTEDSNLTNPRLVPDMTFNLAKEKSLDEIKKPPEIEFKTKISETSGNIIKNFTLLDNESVENNEKNLKLLEIVQNNATNDEVSLKSVKDDEIKKPTELEFKFTTEIPKTSPKYISFLENNDTNLEIQEVKQNYDKIDDKISTELNLTNKQVPLKINLTKENRVDDENIKKSPEIAITKEVLTTKSAEKELAFLQIKPIKNNYTNLEVLEVSQNNLESNNTNSNITEKILTTSKVTNNFDEVKRENMNSDEITELAETTLSPQTASKIKDDDKRNFNDDGN